jgi:hypothetical protein
MVLSAGSPAGRIGDRMLAHKHSYKRTTCSEGGTEAVWCLAVVDVARDAHHQAWAKRGRAVMIVDWDGGSRNGFGGKHHARRTRRPWRGPAVC